MATRQAVKNRRRLPAKGKRAASKAPPPSVRPGSRPRGRPRYDVEDHGSAVNFNKFADTIAIDRSGTTPLWVQLKNQFEAAITSGALGKNSRLPSEHALCEMFDVSRPVVRAALHALAAEGRVIKQPRRGMFVAAPVPQFDFMTSALGVFDDLSAKGYKVSVKTYEYRLHDADEDERRTFKLPAGFQVIRAIRVYSANGRALTHTRISLPAHRLPGMEKIDIENRSIFATIREKFGLTIKHADRWLRAAVPPAEVAARMGIAPGTPMIFIESVAYGHDDNALEYYRAYYNSEVASIHISAEPLKSDFSP